MIFQNNKANYFWQDQSIPITRSGTYEFEITCTQPDRIFTTFCAVVDADDSEDRGHALPILYRPAVGNAMVNWLFHVSADGTIRQEKVYTFGEGATGNDIDDYTAVKKIRWRLLHR